jgi:hypothetical protein
MQAGERRSTLQSEEEIRQVQSEVKIRSEAYFQLLASKRLDEAVQQVAMEGMGIDESKWKKDKLSFQAMAGEPLEIGLC